MTTSEIVIFVLFSCLLREGYSQGTGAKDPNNPACKAVNKADEERDFFVELSNVFTNGSSELLELDIDDKGCVDGAITLPFDLDSHQVTFKLHLMRQSEKEVVVENTLPFSDFLEKFKTIVDAVNCACKCQEDKEYVLKTPVTPKCDEFKLEKFCIFPRIFPQQSDAGLYVLSMDIFKPDGTEHAGLELQINLKH